ncbi:ADP-ribosyltransferase, partial [Actinomadura geliboluensis]
MQPGLIAPMPMGMMGGPAGTASAGGVGGPSSGGPSVGGSERAPGSTSPSTSRAPERPAGDGNPNLESPRPKPDSQSHAPVDSDGVVRNEQTPPANESTQPDGDGPHKKEADGTKPDDGSSDDGSSSEGTPDKTDPADEAQQLADAEQQARDILAQFGDDAPTVDFTSSPIDPAAVREVNNALQALSADYPSTMQGLTHIGSEDFNQSLGPGNDDVLAYATPESNDPGIYLNDDAFADNAQRAEDGADEEATGFTVPGGGSTEGVFTHEFGHHLGEQLLNDPQMLADLNQAVSNSLGIPYDATQPHDPATQQRVENALSDYGSGDPHEMMAEAFTEYRLSENPRPLAQAIGQVMDRHLGANSGNTPAPDGTSGTTQNGDSTQNGEGKPRIGDNQPGSDPTQDAPGGDTPRTDDANPQPGEGSPRTDNEQPRTDEGQPRDGEGQPRDTDQGQPRNDAEGQPRNDGEGQPRDGQPRNDAEGQPRNDGEGQPRNDGEGQPRNDGEGQPRNDGEGQPRDGEGQPRDGQPRDADEGQPRDGQPRDTDQSQPRDTDQGQPRNDGEGQPRNEGEGQPRNDGEGQPRAREGQPEDSADGQPGRRDVPEGLPDRLHDTWRNSAETPAGRALYGPDEPHMRGAAAMVPPDPAGRFVLDAHGDRNGLIVGDQRMNATDLAALIRSDPNWNGRDLLLLSNNSGDGRLAADVAQQLGVRVTAPIGAVDLNALGHPESTGWTVHDPDGGRVAPDPVRRFDTNDEGQRYGDERLGDQYRNLPPELRNALYQYTVQSMPNAFLRPGADLPGYLNHLQGEYGTAWALNNMNGGNGLPTLDTLNQWASNPNLTPDQRALVDHVMSAADPADRLNQIAGNANYWSFLHGYFGETPTVDAFNARVGELDQALNQPLPEPVQTERGLHDVSFMRLPDGTALGPRDAQLLVGTVQTEPGYMSTSLGRDPAVVDNNPFGYRIHMDLPEGSRGVWMGGESAYPDQRELVLPRGTRYEITHVDPDARDADGNPIIEIRATVIPPDPDPGAPGTGGTPTPNGDGSWPGGAPPNPGPAPSPGPAPNPGPAGPGSADPGSSPSGPSPRFRSTPPSDPGSAPGTPGGSDAGPRPGSDGPAARGSDGPAARGGDGPAARGDDGPAARGGEGPGARG